MGRITSLWLRTLFPEAARSTTAACTRNLPTLSPRSTKPRYVTATAPRWSFPRALPLSAIESDSRRSFDGERDETKKYEKYPNAWDSLREVRTANAFSLLRNLTTRSAFHSNARAAPPFRDARWQQRAFHARGRTTTPSSRRRRPCLSFFCALAVYTAGPIRLLASCRPPTRTTTTTGP